MLVFPHVLVSVDGRCFIYTFLNQTTIVMEEAGAQPRPIRLYPDKFEDQVILITGAAQGIGATTAQVFAAQGATVVLVDINQDALADLSQQIQLTRDGTETKESGHRRVPSPICHVCDVSDEKAVNKLVTDVKDRLGHIDVLVHLAGMYPFHLFTEYPSDAYHKVIQVNLDSCFYLIRAVLPQMQRAGYGRIITTASGSLFTPVAGLAAYGAAKGGIMGLTNMAATEAGPGVTANTLVPGLIRTEHMWRGGDTRHLFDSTLEKQCVKRYGRPEDIAHTVCFLASPEAGFITGLSIDIGGGGWFR